MSWLEANNRITLIEGMISNSRTLGRCSTLLTTPLLITYNIFYPKISPIWNSVFIITWQNIVKLTGTKLEANNIVISDKLPYCHRQEEGDDKMNERVACMKRWIWKRIDSQLLRQCPRNQRVKRSSKPSQNLQLWQKCWKPIKIYMHLVVMYVIILQKHNPPARKLLM